MTYYPGRQSSLIILTSAVRAYLRMFVNNKGIVYNMEIVCMRSLSGAVPFVFYLLARGLPVFLSNKN